MPAEKYITGSCCISDGIVSKNGIKVFENPDVDLHSFLLSVYQYLEISYPKFYKMDNLSKLGWLTTEILLTNNYNNDNYQPEETGVILANASSSLDNDVKYFSSVNDVPSPSLFVYTLPNIVIGEICIRNNFKGEHALFIQDVFNVDFIVKQVSYLLDENSLQACVCGWVEVLGEAYKSTLYLVEKQKCGGSVLFTHENADRIFKNSK